MLEGKTAIVTGGTRGIGFATVEKFLENGANVAVLGSRKETVEKALEKLKEKYESDRFIGLAPKLSDEEEVKVAFETVKKTFGSIDILVNNAGISARDSLYEYKLEDFKKIIDLNITSIFNCSKIAATTMKEQGKGVILNTSSMVSLYGQASGCGYPTSKFAVNGLTKSLARELGKDGIRVNAVAPGVIMTDFMKVVPENIIQPIIQNIPFCRIGQPVDISNAFLFLASDMASYITGAILSVDGATMC